MMTPDAVRALIVEDDPSWQQILNEILADCGLIVDLAANLDEAVRSLRENPHRLAVLDLSLGGRDHRNQDGLSVLAAVRRHDPGCVTLFLTGYATVELAVSVIQDHGAFTFLQKETFKRSHFRELVKQSLIFKPPQIGLNEEPSLDLFSQEERDTPQQMGKNAQAWPSGKALVVEDDAGWRSLFREMLVDAGYKVEQSRSYVEAIGLLKRNHYNLAVVDLSLASSLDPQNNLDGYRLLNNTYQANIPTIVVSGFANTDRIEQAYKEYHIFACIEKQSFERGAFTATVRRIQSYEPAQEMLTAREREVLFCLARGFTNKEIANELFVSTNTVKKHLKSIFEKLGVNTRAAASAKAISIGLGTGT
jgi:DNA-binding NarL/FixJ family response regulator